MDAAVSRALRECCGCVVIRGDDVEPLAGSFGGLMVVLAPCFSLEI